MEKEYLLQKQKLNILQNSERRKERNSIENKEKSVETLEKLEKLTMRERGNSANRLINANAIVLDYNAQIMKMKLKK